MQKWIKNGPEKFWNGLIFGFQEIVKCKNAYQMRICTSQEHKQRYLPWPWHSFQCKNRIFELKCGPNNKEMMPKRSKCGKGDIINLNKYTKKEKQTAKNYPYLDQNSIFGSFFCRIFHLLFCYISGYSSSSCEKFTNFIQSQTFFVPNFSCYKTLHITRDHTKFIWKNRAHPSSEQSQNMHHCAQNIKFVSDTSPFL